MTSHRTTKFTALLIYLLLLAGAIALFCLGDRDMRVRKTSFLKREMSKSGIPLEFAKQNGVNISRSMTTKVAHTATWIAVELRQPNMK